MHAALSWLCRGVSVEEGLCLGVSVEGGLCLEGGSVQLGSLSSWGLCPVGVSVQLGSLSRGGNLCPGGLCPEGGLCQGDPPVDRMTDACENITLPQTSFANGKYCFRFYQLCNYEFSTIKHNKLDQEYFVNMACKQKV